MSGLSASERLAVAREQTTLDALCLYAALSRDPAPALDALAAIDPASAERLYDELAERDGTNAGTVKAGADLYRLEVLALPRPAPSGAAA